MTIPIKKLIYFLKDLMMNKVQRTNDSRSSCYVIFFISKNRYQEIIITLAAYNAPEVIFLKKNEQEYLSELKKWMEKTRVIFNENDLNTEETRIWNTLENKINNTLEKNTDFNQITALHEEAEKFIDRFHRNMSAIERKAEYGNHRLPPLPYAYDALEPYISEEIMRLHHLVHHQAYVDGLNTAEKMIYERQLKPEELRHWLWEQAFNGSGNTLHSIFWTNMTPHQQPIPRELAQAIANDFGSVPAFKELFTNTASAVEGPGWAALLYDPINNRLLIEMIEKHQDNQLASMIPLLVLDMWEHAYYLQYKTNKADYINNWWNIVNWQDVNSRLMKAKRK